MASPQRQLLANYKMQAGSFLISQDARTRCTGDCLGPENPAFHLQPPRCMSQAQGLTKGEKYNL